MWSLTTLSACGFTFNQTTIELKFPTRYTWCRRLSAFNQTTIELKLGDALATELFVGLLIRLL